MVRGTFDHLCGRGEEGVSEAAEPVMVTFSVSKSDLFHTPEVKMSTNISTSSWVGCGAASMAFRYSSGTVSARSPFHTAFTAAWAYAGSGRLFFLPWAPELFASQ